MVIIWVSTAWHCCVEISQLFFLYRRKSLIFFLYFCSVGADEKLIDQLSNEAKEKFSMATSLFSNILNRVITGKITIKLLNHILQKRSTFLELLNLGIILHT